MSEDEISLPEKSYFSVLEIAERWGCSSEQVIHYMDEGQIRPAIKSVDIFGLGIFDLDVVIEAEKRAGRDFHADIWQFATGHSIDKQNIIDATLWFRREFRFYYINRQDIEHIGDRTVISMMEDLGRHKYGLVRGCDTYEPAVHDITNLVIRGDESPYILVHHPYTWNPLNVIVSREERDRFEFEHSISRNSERQSEYDTAYLKVLREAIFEFFEPRRQLDAKSEVVVEWIENRLQLAGLEGSRRIAHAMFTIIKPVDHNPRKRRG
ncbi:MAG: hypothetical protein H6991_04640 [Pseudomonadales bacterium]|nr:hypothetical protein [Pseudomonadales bacterium]